MSRISLSRHPRFAALFVGCCALLALPASAPAADGEATPLSLNSAPAKAADTAAAGGSSGILRTIIGLAVVIAVIYGLTCVLKFVKRSREAQASGTALQALATLPLGPNRALHLVRAGDVVVLLGVGEGGVTTIRTYHEQEARALGLIGAEYEPGALETVAVAVGIGGGVPGGSEVPSGRVARAIDGLRRRTVIR